MTAHAAVHGYLEHLQDFDWLEQQLRQTRPQDVEAVVLDALAPPLDAQRAGHALLFIQDAVTLSPAPLKPLLAVHEPSAAVLTAVERLVFCDVYVLRRRAIYTLAKICAFASAPVLANRFEHSLHTDPLLLPNLVAENAWLRGPALPGFPDVMLRSPQPLTRWALVPLLYAHPWSGEPQARMDALRTLLQDRAAPVGEEAAYGITLLKAQREDHTVTRAQQRALVREAEELRPAVTFEDLELRFSNHLAHLHQADYSVAELAHFAERELVLNVGTLAPR